MRKTLAKFIFSCHGITSIEYAIIGVSTSVALFYILDNSSIIQTLNEVWIDMARNVNGSLNG